MSSLPAQYRPAPFWSWNDKLDPEELRRQIRAMHDAGLGGFFMHARGGLQTVYLSDDWMACVRACLDEAGKVGMNAWLYDENGWPSGFGGGLVNGLGEAYQQKYLRHEIVDAPAVNPPRTIAYYTPDGLTWLGHTLPPEISGKVLRCFYEVNPFYVDNLDAKVVREFIRVTHQFYYDHLPEELKRHLAGIFTDEPQLSRAGLVWSQVLEQEYRRAYGRELLPELPALFLNLPGGDAVRVRFWKLVTRLFNDSFMKQIREWCNQHGWMLTGHHVLEERFKDQISSNGAVMAQYRYYHIPGMDHLCRQEPDPLAMTQVISSAAQFGQKRILTESFALSGWNFNFSGMKWMYQQQLAHGINFLCPHLESYSLRGLRKRDYPPSLFVHQPWWGNYARLNDYFARASMLVAESKPMIDVLVAHSISTAWMHYTGSGDETTLDHYNDALLDTTRALDALQIGHHYADETIVDQAGSIQAGKIRIGEIAYRIVILPQLVNLSAKLAAMLREFSAAGGTVLAVRNRLEPGRLTIDGEPADAETRVWFDALPAFDTETAAAAYTATLLPERLIATEHGVATGRLVSTARRQDDFNGRSGCFYFVATLQYNQPCQATLSLPRGNGAVEWIDPATGECRTVENVCDDGTRLSFECPLAAGDGVMFFVADRAPEQTAPRKRLENIFSRPAIKPLDNEFELTAHTGNFLTLDRCHYRVDGAEWIADDVSVIHTRLLRLGKPCELELEYEFELAPDFDLGQKLTLVTETPERYQFALNHRTFAAEATGTVFDQAFHRVELPQPLLRPGRNLLGMKMRYFQSPEVYEALERAKKFETEYNKLTYDTEVESVYLMGDFTVRHRGREAALLRGAERFHGTFELSRPATGSKVDAADLVKQGLPFFAGHATFAKTFQLTEAERKAIGYLRFTPVGANGYRIRLNGREAGSCFWGPYALPVADLLQTGENRLEIELETSLRNLLGPHHLEEGESYAVHTMSFSREANVIGWGVPQYNAGYCFVKLGLQDLTLA